MSCIIRTYTGKDFDVMDPRPDMFDIRDIAHALSNKCRFSGMTREFYSVAQHCIYAENLIMPRTQALHALLHEIGEAYLADVPTPIKAMWAGFKECESRIHRRGLLHFGALDPWPVSEDVHEVDRRLLVTEAYQLMRCDVDYLDQRAFAARAYSIDIEPLPPRVAEQLFLARCESLGGCVE